jgi:hypothetical protein
MPDAAPPKNLPIALLGIPIEIGRFFGGAASGI